SDGSGTSFIWTDFLSLSSAEWKSKIGAGTSVKWPLGIAGERNDGVSSLVSGHIGAIGYVELTYALEHSLPYAQIRNREGVYVSPSPERVTAAAAALLQTIPDDLCFSLKNAPGKLSYPLAGTAWAIIYVNQTHNKTGRELIAFLRWATHEGQAYVKELKF